MDLNLLPDETLVKMAQEKDTLAMQALIERYKGLVRKATRSYFLIGGDNEDLLQEGMFGVFKAVETFNGKSSFKSYAYLCVKSVILTAIKNSNREKHKPLNNYISLTGSADGEDKTDIIVNADSEDPETELINEEALKELKEKIKTALSGYEYKILGYYLEGYSYLEIGQKIGKEQKSVDNALQRIRKKLVVLKAQ